jgi:queuine tRNA-ribosyltransferase
LNFILESESSGSKARAAIFQTLHGEVKTPIFMPVGTQATVKGQTVESLKATGARVLLVNTYHLLLRPGPEVLKQFAAFTVQNRMARCLRTPAEQFFTAHSENQRRTSFSELCGWKSYLLSPESSIEMRKP